MKLPDVKYRQVETVGRHDLGALDAMAAAVGQRGQVMQQGAGMLVSASQDYLDRKQNAEYDDQIASMQIEFDEWNKQYGAKDVFTADEVTALGLPSHLINTTQTTSDGGGRQIKSKRDNIPAYEVYPHLLRAKLAGMTADKVEKISNPHLRKEFARKADVNAANLNLQAAFNAENQQEKFVLDKAIFDYQNAGDRGDGIAGEFYIDGAATDDLHKEKMRQDLYYRVEYSDASGALRSNDPETVMVWLSRLTDPQYEGDLPEPQRQAFAGALQTKLDILGANQVAELDRQEGIRFVNMVEKTKTGGSSLAEIQEGFDKHVIDPDDAEGWTAAQYGRLMDLQRGYEQSVIVEDRRLEAERVAQEKADKIQTDKAYKKANGLFISDTHAGIDKNEVQIPDVERSYAQYLDSLETGIPNPNTVNASQRTALRHHIMERDNKAKKATEDFTLGKALVDGKQPANRENGKHQTGIDKYVEDMQITSVSELVKITQDTNIMPQVMEDAVVHSAYNLKDGEGIPGLAVWGSLSKKGMHGKMDVGASVGDLMNTAWEYHRNGMSAEESLTKAHELSQMPESEREYNKKAYKELNAYDKNMGFLETKMEDDENSLYPFDAGFTKAATAPNSQMGAAYQYLVAKEFERTGNLDLARNTAWNKLTEVWSPSGVGVRMEGIEISSKVRPDRYGVERTLGITTPVANNRLAAFAAANELDVGTIIVNGDGFTARDGKSWQIMVVDPDTLMMDQLVDIETGLPVRWIPADWEDEGKKYGYEQSVQKAIDEKARQESLNITPPPSRKKGKDIRELRKGLSSYE